MKASKTLSALPTAVTVIGDINSAAQGVITILELIGVMESTNDKIDNVVQQIESLEHSITSLNARLATFANNITNQFVKTDELSYITIYNTSKANWNSYMNGSVTKFINTKNDFDRTFNTKLVNYVDSASTYRLTVYYNTKGDVVMPRENSKDYAFDGTKIDKSKTVTYVLGTSLTTTLDNINSHNGRTYSTITSDIKKNLKSILKDDKKVSDYYDALILKINAEALQQVGYSKIIDACENMFNDTSGNAGGGPAGNATTTPLDDYYTMLSTYYNFQSEAQADIDNMRKYIQCKVTEAKELLLLVEPCFTGYKSESINKAYDRAYEETKTNTGLHTSTTNAPQWSYVLDSFIKRRELMCYINKQPFSLDQDIEREINERRSKHQDHSDLDAKVYYWFDTPYAEEAQIKIMVNRWSRLKKAGVTTQSTFDDYLMNAKIIKNKLEYLVENPVIESMPYDGSYTLVCSRTFGDYFKEGNSYKIGTSGKLERKYFEEGRVLRGKFLKVNDNSISTDSVINASVTYNESHWYWHTQELAEFLQYLYLKSFNVIELVS